MSLVVLLALGLVPVALPAGVGGASPAAAAAGADISGDSPVQGTVGGTVAGPATDPDQAAAAAPDVSVAAVPDAGALPTETVGVAGELQFASPTVADRVEIAEPSVTQVDEIQAVQAETPLPAVDGAAEQVIDGTATGTTGLATLGDAIRVESLGELPVDGAVTPAGQVDETPPVWGLRLSRESTDASGSGVARVQVSYQGLDGGLGGDYGSRLKLTVYPSCIVTTPEVPACLQGVPLDTVNDPTAQTVEATVPFEDAATGDVAVTDLTAPPATTPGTAPDPTASPSATAPAGAGSVRASLVRRALAGSSPKAASGAALRAVVSSSSSVLAVSAAASGPGGTYAATDLKPTGSWTAGGSTGSFTYSYPIPTVPSVGGAAPSLAFEYDSASVDGASTASNSQSSWVGRGWDLSTGFIERRYVGCSMDGHSTWGDLCWHSPYSDKTQAPYVVSMPGAQSELILDAAATPAGHVYRTEQDNGWRFYRTTAGGSDNPDADNEAWRVESPDGSIYRFGYSRITLANGTNVVTNSVATVPVWSDTGEPLGSGWHTRAYRWYLDQVTDVHENAINYFYNQDTNYYHRTTSGADVSYVESVYPDHIDYGQQSNELTSTPPARISFATVGRCFDANTADPWAGQPGCATSAKSTPGQYPDVPADLICSGTCTSEQNSPTFFLRSRLAKVHTYARTTDNTGYDLVYTTMPRYSFPATDDGNDPSLWLDWIQVRGYQGADVTGPATNFNGTNMRNRVDWNTGLGVKALDKRRITSITNDTGGQILVDYNGSSHDDACPQGGSSSSGWSSWYSTVDGNWDHNRWLCYPVMFDPDGAGGIPAGFGIFHKYVVTAVTLHDRVGGSPDETWAYTYVDNPAWAYHSDIIGDISEADGMPQTWDTFRGYHDVKVRHGAGTDSDTTETWYFNGMDGDHNADGTTKSVTFNDINEPSNIRTDGRWVAGQPEESRTYDDDGTTTLSKSVYYYTNVRSLNGPGVHNANMARRSTTWGKSRGNAADGTWVETQSTSYWNSYGLLNKVNDSHEIGVADNQCLDTDYAVNVTAPDAGSPRYIVIPQDQKTFENPTACDDASSSSTQGALVARTSTYYDGATMLSGATGTQVDNTSVYDANPTSVRVYNSSTASLLTKSAFDRYGRLTSVATPYQQSKGTDTFITYNDSVSGWTTSVVTRLPKESAAAAPVTTTANMSRLHTDPNSFVDVNGNYTWIDHDGFQRVTQVQKTPPSATTATKGTQASAQTVISYAYPASAASGATMNTAPRVKTTTLTNGTGNVGAGGTFQDSYTFVDGFGRLRQQQSRAPLVTSPATNQTVMVAYHYDDRGIKVGQSAPTWFSNAPGGLIANDAADLFKSWTHTDYDALDRPYQTITYGLGVEKLRSTTAYWHDHVTTTSPLGATTSTYADARGRTTKAVHSTGTGPVTTTYAYTYTANTGSTVTVTAPPTLPGGTAASTTTFTADMAGRRISVADSDAGTSSNGYDTYGRTSTLTTPTGKVTTGFDVLDRATSQTVTDSAGTTTYQANTYKYDTATNGIGLPATTTAVTSPGGSQGNVTTATSVAGYDNYGRPAATTQNVTFAATTGITGINNLPVTNTYTYDAAGHTLSITHPALGGLPAETITAGYNEYGLPTTLKTTSGATTTDIIGATIYTGSGLVDSRDYGTSTANGVHRWLGYDMVRRAPDSLLTGYGAATSGAATLWQNVLYHRSKDGDITSVTDQVDSQAQCYAYDEAHRLTQATTTAPGTLIADPDGVTSRATVDCGNGTTTGPLAAADTDTGWNTGPGAYRTKWTIGPSGAIATVKNYVMNGTSSISTTRTYNYTDTTHPGRLASVTPSLTGTTNSDTFTYDTAGAAAAKTANAGGSATTQTMTTAPNGDLLSLITTGAIAGDARYGYDTTGGRTARITNTAITIYAGATEVTFTRTSGTVIGTRRYTQGGVVAATRVGNGLPAYLFDDLQNSNTISVPATGSYTAASGSRQRYLPYGGLRGQTSLSLPTQHAWLDQTSDPDTGLIYLNHRYYDPSLARFLAPDPVAVPDRPQDLNPYTYAGDNPVTYADPSGLEHGEETGDNCVASCGLQPGSSPEPRSSPVVTQTTTDRGTSKGTGKGGSGAAAPRQAKLVEVYSPAAPSTSAKDAAAAAKAIRDWSDDYPRRRDWVTGTVSRIQMPDGSYVNAITFSKSIPSKLVELLKSYNISIWVIRGEDKTLSHGERAQTLVKEHYQRIAQGPVRMDELGVSNNICPNCIRDVVPELAPSDVEVGVRGWGGLSRVMRGIDGAGKALGVISFLPDLIKAGQIGACSDDCHIDVYTGTVTSKEEWEQSRVT